MRLLIGLIAMLQILFATTPTTTPQPSGVADLANQAKLITVGAIISASPDGLRALMKVTEYFKSGVPQASLQLAPSCATADCATTQAHYQAGQQVVLFLQPTDDGWTTVQDAAGMYVVRDSIVYNASNTAVGSLDDVKAQLVQLTGQQGAAAPDYDPTPETQTAPVASDTALSPALYIAAIAVGVIGIVAMVVLARRIK